MSFAELFSTAQVNQEDFTPVDQYARDLSKVGTDWEKVGDLWGEGALPTPNPQPYHSEQALSGDVNIIGPGSARGAGLSGITVIGGIVALGAVIWLVKRA